MQEKSKKSLNPFKNFLPSSVKYVNEHEIGSLTKYLLISAYSAIG